MMNNELGKKGLEDYGTFFLDYFVAELLVMTVGGRGFWGILRGLPLRRWGGGKDRSTLCEDFGARGGCPPLIMKILCWLLKWEKKSII